MLSLSGDEKRKKNVPPYHLHRGPAPFIIFLIGIAIFKWTSAVVTDVTFLVSAVVQKAPTISITSGSALLLSLRITWHRCCPSQDTRRCSSHLTWHLCVWFFWSCWRDLPCKQECQILFPLWQSWAVCQ